MKKLLFALLLTPLTCIAQNKIYWSKVHNVYGRSVSAINDYAEEFIKAHPLLFNQGGKDTVFSEAGKYTRVADGVVVHAQFYLNRPATFCFGSMVFDANVAFMAKDSRTRIEFQDVKYAIIPPGGKSECAGSGDYAALKATKCCKGYEYLDQFLYERFTEICADYKVLLKEKRSDKNW